MQVVNIIEEGRFGGPQKRITEVARELLNKNNVETLVLLPQKNAEAFTEYLAENNVLFKQLPLNRLTKSPWGLMKYFLLFFYELYLLCKVLRQAEPDVVHCNGSWQIKGILAAYILRIPSVWHLNDTYCPTPVRIVFKLLSRRLPNIHYIVASRRTANYYLPAEEKRKTITLVEAPIDLNKFSNTTNIIPLPIITAHAGIKIVTVGNVNPVKGYEVFLEVANQLKRINKERIPVHFFVVGAYLANQSRYKAQLLDYKGKKQLDNVHFLGSSKEIPAALKAANIYLCTSHYESSPISVWEAMAMGKAVVATDVGDVKRIFEENDCGIVTNTNDPESLANKILQLLESPTQITEFGERAIQVAQQTFGLDSCVKKHYHVYQKALRSCTS